MEKVGWKLTRVLEWKAKKLFPSDLNLILDELNSELVA